MLQFGYNTGVINAPEQVSCELAQQQLEMFKLFDVDLSYLSDSFQHQSFNQDLYCKTLL